MLPKNCLAYILAVGAIIFYVTDEKNSDDDKVLLVALTLVFMPICYMSIPTNNPLVIFIFWCILTPFWFLVIEALLDNNVNDQTAASMTIIVLSVCLSPIFTLW